VRTLNANEQAEGRVDDDRERLHGAAPGDAPRDRRRGRAAFPAAVGAVVPAVLTAIGAAAMTWLGHGVLWPIFPLLFRHGHRSRRRRALGRCPRRDESANLET
jgi:hypothetical protein